MCLGGGMHCPSASSYCCCYHMVTWDRCITQSNPSMQYISIDQLAGGCCQIECDLATCFLDNQDDISSCGLYWLLVLGQAKHLCNVGLW